jgi:hypothetical protein
MGEGKRRRKKGEEKNMSTLKEGYQFKFNILCLRIAFC